MVDFSLSVSGPKEQYIFQPAACYTKQWTGDVVVIGNCKSPTVDFYFRSRKHQVRQYFEFDINSNKCLKSVITNGCAVVLVRDVPLPILKSLLLYREAISEVIWFTDDDIPGAGGDTSLPVAYRKRLFSWYKKARPYLARLCSKISVSTQWLATKYELPESSVLSPLDSDTKQQSMVRCFYHGSGSHTLDWDFVIEVARKVQQRNDNISFEFIGDHALYKRCKDIPRVQILHPMPWSNYVALTANRIMDIGLAPLHDNPFNKARSHTKFLDICRQRAVGIYSIGFPFFNEIKRCNAGVVLSNDPESWVHSIEKLAASNRKPILESAEKLKTELVKVSGALNSII